MRIVILVLASTAIVISGCNDSHARERKEQPASTIVAPPPPPEPVAPAPTVAAAPAPSANAADGDVVEFRIESVAETMTFNVTSLTVQTGKKVHVVLKNNAKSPLMPHNWLLVTAGTEAAVALAGLTAGKDTGYLPKNADVLAATPLAPPGGTAEITFTAPAPGTYAYICTVPGHYMMMKGKLTVTP
jgi:azurin